MEDIFSQSSDALVDGSANPPEGLPDGIYTYEGVDALYKKENGRWFKKIGQANYAPLEAGDVEERIKLLEEKAVAVPEDNQLIERFTNIQDIDVNQPVQQYKEVFEAKESPLVKQVEPVKKADEYKIDENNGVQTWQKKKEVKIQERIDPKTGQPMGMSYVNVYEDVTDPKKVAELNKKNGVQASTDKEQQIFTGYPGQEGSEYRINDDGLWETKRPGSNEFLTIVNPKSVSALNAHFKQNAEVFDDKKAEEIKRKNEYINNFNIRLNNVNKDLIGGSEGNAVETLSKLFPEFKFEQTGIMTDNIKVSKINNGVTVASDEISLDNFFDNTDKQNAQVLKDWLRTNVVSDLNNSYKAYNEAVAGVEKRISETIYGQDPEISKVVSDATSLDKTILNEQIRRDVSGLSSVFFPEETKKAKEAGEQLTKDYAKVVRDTYARVKNKSKEEQATAFMAIKTDDIIINAANNYSNEVKDNYNTFVSQQKNFNQYVNDINTKLKSGEISQEEYDNNYRQKIKDGAADLEMKGEKVKGDLTSLNYYVKGSEKAIASNLMINEMTGTTAGAFGRSIVDGAMSVPTFIAGMNKEQRTEFVNSIVGVGTTEEYMQSKDRSDLTKAALSMVKSISAMTVGKALGSLTGVPGAGDVGSYISLYAMGYNEMRDTLDGVGDISSEDKVLMSSLYALVGAGLENYGLSYLTQKTVAKRAASSWILKNAFSQLSKNASKEMIEAQIMNSTKLYATRAAITTAGSSAVEAGVEMSQAAAQKLVQEAYDQIKGTDYFNNESAWKITGDIAYEGYMGLLGAGMVESAQQSVDVLSRGVNALKNNDQIKLLITSANVEGIDNALLTNLKASMLSGKMSKGEAKEIVESFKEIKGKINSMPEDMSIDNKSVALDLMIERDNLNKKIEGKDPFLVVKEKERIGQINEQLKNLGNAVQEPSTEGVLQREQEGVTEAGGERGGVEPIVQGEEVTREGETKAVQEEVVPGATAKIADVDIVYPTEPQAEERKAFRSTSEYVENASKELPVEDVETLTKELDGDFGLLTAENPMAQPLTEEENKQLNQKAEEWLTGRGYNPRRVTGKYGQAENSFFVPNLTRQDAIDFAKQFNQEAVAHSDGLVYQDGSMNPRVKADDNLSFTDSYSPDSDFVSVVNTKDGLKTFSIGYNFDEKVMPEQQAATQISEVTITPETRQTVTERINKETDTKRKKVFTAVQKVLSAIPNSRIILHDNVDAFVSGVAKSAGITNDEAISQGVNNNRGSYVNGDIHINLETAGVTTVFHEAFHDLLAKKGMENNALLDMAKGLKSVISDKALKTRLDDFVSNYEQGERAEEYTTELGAIMAEAQKELSTTKFQQFKTLVNKIAKKLGMPVVFSAASNAQDAVDFMNSMAGKLGKGENILTDGLQTTIVSDKIKAEKPVNVNTNQKLTFVKQSDIIDIKSLIDEIVSKNQTVWFWVADQLGRGFYFDSVINGEHYLDAGPSYALDPENKSKGIIWASGANPTTISKNIEKSDYIFIVSGSPQLSKLFNKSVANIVRSRIESKVDFNEFKNNILNSKPTKPIRDIINKYNSYDELFNGSDRKSFIIAINEQQSKDTKLKKLLESYDAFVDPNELRDGFYKDNDFQMGDVMLVLKPEKIGDKSKHSTYETDIIGSVVGVPDMVINSYDLMPEDIKNKYKENLERAKQQQVVAPYGMGVKQISKIKAQRTAPGNKLFNEPLKDAETIAKSYMKSVGMDYVPVEKITKLDENLSKRISDAYDKMKNDPNDPKVKAAYEAMAKETLEQHKAIIDKGYKVEINNTEPYSDSGAMIEDLRDNKRMKIFSTESGFGDEPITDEQRKENPLLRDSGFKDVNGETLLVNDVFRFVHDFFGHAKLGNSFGPIGEENAWRVHSEMYSPEARKAMTSETRGQNSWVNFSGVNDAVFKKRDKARQLRKEGKIEEANQMVGEVYEEMSFADQKVGLLPDFAFEEGRPSKIKAQKQSKEDAIQDAKDKYELSVEKRGKDHKTGVTAAIADLQKSDWYRDADDIQREEAVREIKKFFGEKLKAAPSIAKVTGKNKQTAFVSDLAAAIRDQVRLQARSSRETAKNINDRRKALGVAIKDVVKEYKGKITERQLNAINRKIANVNLFNQEMVERVIDYVNKVMNNAEYATKVNNAFAERRAIRRMMKSGNMAETVAVAKEFTQIDPSMVDDIDTYLEMAQKIRGAVKSSKRVKDSVSLKEIINFGEAYEYINPVLKAQEESMKNMLLAEYNDLAEAGVISKDMTLKDINNIIKNIRAAKDEEVTAEQEETAREFLKQRLESIKSIISMVAKGYNPLTGEVMEISDRNKQMIAKVVKSDMNNMSTKQLIEMVDSLSNFVENGAVSGIEAAYETYIGEENAASLEREGVVAKTVKLYASKKIGGIQAFSFMSLPELFNRMFGGVKNGIKVMTKMGFSDIILGANKAKKLAEQIQKRYVDKFGDVKGFFDNENIYERGALAFLTRNVIGSEAEIKSEFNRRVDWLFESFERLKNGTAEEQKMAVVYGKIIDKLDIKSRDLEKIYSKADKTNVEAVNWWVEEWSKHYSDLSDVSRSVYNAILGKDTGYTPDRLKMTSKESSDKTTSKDLMDLMERNSSFLINTDAITNTNESGVMIASIRPEVKNTKGRYVSLDFEINNIDSLTGALVDINTAGAIRRLDSFMKSKSFDKIIPNTDDQIRIKKRINRYVRRIKNKMPASSDSIRDFNKIIDTAASLGASIGLGGAFQIVKQTVSVAMSTALQTGGNFNMYAGKSFNDWLDTTGATVANRGQESISAIESANKKIQSFSGNFDRTLKAVSKATQWQLKLVLSRPDVFVARAAFKSYYEQFLKDNGYDVSKINWDTWADTIKREGIEELNKEAIVYADTMVSRQQNVSDERLAGEALASENDWVKLSRKVLLPFASFSINQRARLINDLTTIKNKTASREDVSIAWKSLFGTLVEQATFQAINYSIGMLLYSAAQGIAGHDDDEEEWEKRKKRATQYPLRSLAADITSPSPLVDDLFIDFYDLILSNMAGPSESEINKAINDEKKLREELGKDFSDSQIKTFREKYIEDNTYQLSPNYINAEDGKWGMLSIASDQVMRLSENSEMATKGTFTSDYQGKETTKYLTDKDRRIAQGVFYMLDVPYTTGAGFKEMGQVANKTYSIIKKRALTENQYETYKQFKKDFKREPQEWEINLIKSTKSDNKALGELDFIKEQGGLSPKQGVEYLNVFKKIGPLNPEEYRMIINGKKADQVIKSVLK